MKTPSFWYAPPSFLSALLAPLGACYRWAGQMRRAGASPLTGKFPVICVGNIVAGGAGKTPTALALARLLKKQGGTPVFVTRGYGGKACEPLRVNPDKHSFTEVGDEALLLAREAPCWVGRDRAAALREAEEEKGVTHIILDDGLQNPSVAPWLSFLVVDGAVGFGNGALIPAGPLRETLDDALPRIAAVVMVGEDRHGVAQDCGRSILRAKIRPFIPDDFPDTRPFLAFAGLGRPEKFFALCRETGLKLQKTIAFADHHPYTEANMTRLVQDAEKAGAQLLTTAKDFVRIPDCFRAKVAVLPVELIFEDPQHVLTMIQAESVALKREEDEE